MFAWLDSACWILVIVLALAIEAFTLNLSAIWFAVGGIGSLIATTLQCSIPVHGIVFLVVSGVSLVLARPMAVKMIGTKRTATNADRILGEQAMVTQTISNPAAQGEIKHGQHWTARSADGRRNPRGNHGSGARNRGSQSDCRADGSGRTKGRLRLCLRLSGGIFWAYFIVHCISYFCDCTAGTCLYYRTLRQLSSNLEKWCTF